MNGSKNGGTGNIAENGTADVAVDQYHRYKVWSLWFVIGPYASRLDGWLTISYSTSSGLIQVPQYSGIGITDSLNGIVGDFFGKSGAIILTIQLSWIREYWTDKGVNYAHEAFYFILECEVF